MEKIGIAASILLLLLTIIRENRFLLLVSSLILTVVLIYRSFLAGYPPIFNPFDTILLFSLLFQIVSFFLKVSNRITSGLALLFTLPLLFFKTGFKEIPPIIRTPLFFIHVGTAMVSYSLFLIASIFAAFNLFGKDYKTESVVKWGLFLFTLSLVVGGVWAFLAWGDLFPLEPKSLFSLFMWFYFSHLVHLKYDKEHAKLKIILTLIGGLVVLFTFLGVNFLFGGTHGF